MLGSETGISRKQKRQMLTKEVFPQMLADALNKNLSNSNTAKYFQNFHQESFKNSRRNEITEMAFKELEEMRSKVMGYGYLGKIDPYPDENQWEFCCRLREYKAEGFDVEYLQMAEQRPRGVWADTDDDDDEDGPRCLAAQWLELAALRKLDESQDFPGNRPRDGQGSDSDYEFPSEGQIIIVDLPPDDPRPDVPATVTLQHWAKFLHAKTDVLNKAMQLEEKQLNATQPFKDHPEQHEMAKAFDYEDRVLVDQKTGEVTMKLFYMHPGRKQNGIWNYCGCYFSAGLWKEYKTVAGKTRWNCACDMDQVEAGFPEEYKAALANDPDLRSKTMVGTCGMKYRAHKDGPAMLVELLVNDEWIPMVTEFMPETILGKFKEAQAEWYEVLNSSSAADVKAKILRNQVKPSIQSLIVPGPGGLKVIGKFPLKDFYDSGGIALTQEDWVQYFIEVSMLGTTPGLKMLEKVCRKWLEQKGLPERKIKPEYLPSDLSTGQISFSSSSGINV